MLKTKEFQPSVLRLRVNGLDYKCPFCGDERYGEYYLPDRCKNCNAIFEWKVLVHYREEEPVT